MKNLEEILEDFRTSTGVDRLEGRDRAVADMESTRARQILAEAGVDLTDPLHRMVTVKVLDTLLGMGMEDRYRHAALLQRTNYDALGQERLANELSLTGHGMVSALHCLMLAASDQDKFAAPTQQPTETEDRL